MCEMLYILCALYAHGQRTVPAVARTARYKASTAFYLVASKAAEWIADAWPFILVIGVPVLVAYAVALSLAITSSTP